MLCLPAGRGLVRSREQESRRRRQEKETEAEAAQEAPAEAQAFECSCGLSCPPLCKIKFLAECTSEGTLTARRTQRMKSGTRGSPRRKSSWRFRQPPGFAVFEADVDWPSSSRRSARATGRATLSSDPTPICSNLEQGRASYALDISNPTQCMYVRAYSFRDGIWGLIYDGPDDLHPPLPAVHRLSVVGRFPGRRRGNNGGNGEEEEEGERKRSDRVTEIPIKITFLP